MQAGKAGGDFLALCKADGEIKKHLSADEIASMFDMAYHMRHIDTIFERVFPG